MLASAQVETLRGQHDKALKLLETYYTLMPDNYPLSVTYLRALTDAGDYSQARQVAARAISMRADDATLYRLVGRVEVV